MPTLCSSWTRPLRDVVRSLDLHLKIDTGMGRIGFLCRRIRLMAGSDKQLKAVKVVGIFSHFSHAESVEGQYTRKQIEIFNDRRRTSPR